MVALFDLSFLTKNFNELIFYEFENTKKLFSIVVLKPIFLDLVFKNWEQKIEINIFVGDETHKRTKNEMKPIILDLVFNN